ncbi:MAG: rRNA processing protein RimM [Bacteroidota bacterium]|jgi:16S rRNA processing protein RimM
MTKSDCFLLGSIAKLHGFKGEVSLFLDVSNPSDYTNIESIFLEINGQLIPYFITSFKLKNKGFAAVKFEGVDNEAQAKVLLKKEVFLPTNLLVELDEEHFYDHEVIGFAVFDSRHGVIGSVETVVELPNNPLLQINFNGKEILVPFFDGLIQKVDREKRELFLNTPEGLIELYL